jgi:broad specificity phosphatase PhoE
MRIVLLRHGKPDVPELGKLRASEIQHWIDSYNSAGLRADHQPPRETVGICKDCEAVVCSNLPRSVESARALGVKKVNYIESLFREMELPYSSFPSPKLPPDVWAALFRVLWFFGFSSNSESLSEAKTRALNGANRLKEIAAESGSVLLVGHGFVNRFIAKELLSSGWQGPANPGQKHWEFGVYECATEHGAR